MGCVDGFGDFACAADAAVVCEDEDDDDDDDEDAEEAGGAKPYAVYGCGRRGGDS